MNFRTGNRSHGHLTGHLTLTFRSESLDARPALRRRMATMILCLFAIVGVAGCATTKVTNRQELATGQLPRPEHIWVYDFAATADEVPAYSGLAGQTSATSQTEEHIATGRRLGAEITAQLVEQIQGMGLQAARAGARTNPQINDILIRGYLVSVEEGSAAKRLVIGFGAGTSELRTAAEGYQMTARGPRKLGSGTVDSGGSKGPGAALGVVGLVATGNPAGLIISTGMKVYGEESGRSTVEGRAKQTATEIAEVLKSRFEEQGWIQ
jgi:uncharacterized protein DUF4410